MLKYENTAETGDLIRAFDFQPMPGRTDRFVEGLILAKSERHGAYVFIICVTKDSSATETYDRTGEHVFVPFEMDFDFDGRVENIS